jgi:hypothetical protein
MLEKQIDGMRMLDPDPEIRSGADAREGRSEIHHQNAQYRKSSRFGIV